MCTARHTVRMLGNNNSSVDTPLDNVTLKKQPLLVGGPCSLLLPQFPPTLLAQFSAPFSFFTFSPAPCSFLIFPLAPGIFRIFLCSMLLLIIFCAAHTKKKKNIALHQVDISMQCRSSSSELFEAS